MRVGTPKFQALHGFRRGQPVVRSGGRFILASEATGWDGMVGSVLSADQFELVTGGELDGLVTLLAPGDGTVWYLSSAAGALSQTGTTAVGRVFGRNLLLSPLSGPPSEDDGVNPGSVPWSDAQPTSTVFRSTGSPGTSEAGLVREDHKHTLELGSTLTRLADASEAGIAMVLAATPDDQEALLGIALLRADLAQYMTLDGSAHTGAWRFTFPDQNGTVAVLEREQTFTKRQHVTGDTPTDVDNGEVSLGGGSGWFGGRLEVGTNAAAPASQFGGAYPGVGVLPASGKITLGGGWGGFGQGITVSGGNLVDDPFGGSDKRTSVLFQPRTAWDGNGLHFTWCNPPAPSGNGKLIAHVGIADGTSMDFSADGLTGGVQFYTNTGPTSAQACIKLLHTFTVQCPGYNPPTPAANTIEMGKGSLWAANWATANELGVGINAAPSTYYADFDSATKWARFRGAVPSVDAVAGETLLGAGTQQQCSSQDQLHLWKFAGLEGGYITLEGLSETLGRIGSARLLLTLTDPITECAIIANRGLALGAYNTRYLDINGDGVSTFYGTGAIGVTAGKVKIGGGEIGFAGNLNSYTSGNGLRNANVATPGTVDGIRLYDTGAIYFGQPASTEFKWYIGTAIPMTLGTNLVVAGTAPTSVSAGQVAIGGGNLWTAADAVFGVEGDATIKAARIWGSNGTAEGNGCRLYLDDDITFYNAAGTALADFDAATNAWRFMGTAPSSVSAGQVAIGGGELWTAGSARIGAMRFNSTGQINMPAGDADTLGIYLNYTGYNGGTTRFRDTLVYDGKSTLLLGVNGASGVTTVYGTAPTAVATGEVKLGGGEIWSRGSAHIGLASGSLYVDGGDTGSVDSGQVRIGAGIIRAATLRLSGLIYAGGGSVGWELGGYTAGAPTATGYVDVWLNGTKYRLLAAT